MDTLYTSGISAIALIQDHFQPHENSLIFLSKLFDPRYAFLIFSPLVYSLHAPSGVTLIWTTVLAEFINQILKWLLMSDRPYWWVQESELVYNRTGSAAPHLKQFPLTCETGPGSPSGHAMLTAAVWFVLISSVLRHYKKHKLPTLGPLRVFLWIFYAASIIGVSVSRLYLSAHFPHQCVLGALLGLVVAVAVTCTDLSKFKVQTYITGTVLMLTVVAATYGLLIVTGVNPGWTIAKALKWCFKKEHVHMDTTPFFSIMRYTGFFMGAGIGLSAAPEPLVVRPPHISRPNESMKVRGINFLTATISILVINVFNSIAIPSGNMIIFYLLSFLMNIVQPVLFIALIPRLVCLFFSVSKKQRLA